MSIFNNLEENYWRNLITKTILVIFTVAIIVWFCHAMRADSSVTMWETLDVRFCDCHLRLPDLQDR